MINKKVLISSQRRLALGTIRRKPTPANSTSQKARAAIRKRLRPSILLRRKNNG